MTRLIVLICTAFLILTGCATRPTDPEQLAIYEQNNDPLEPMNRAIFSFNMAADEYVLEPVAKGYAYITPKVVQEAGYNFFENLKQPIYLANSLLELDFKSAGTIAGRFAINTLFGFLGCIDTATELEVPVVKRTFGDTLVVWGVKDGGPYLVLPILGPANVRDGIGKGVDYFSAIHGWFFHNIYIRVGLWGYEGIHYRISIMELADNLKKSSTDLYATMRSMYQQNRQKQIKELLGEAPEEEAKPAYDFDFPDDEEE